MAPNVTLHFFPANDLNGDILHEITDEDEYFRGLKLKLERDGLGGAELHLARRVGFAGFGSGTFDQEVFVRVLISAYSDTVYYPWGFFLNKRQQTVIHKDEDGGEVFIFGGAGPKQYLSRAALGIGGEDSGWNVDLANGVWRWGDSATVGKILRQIIQQDSHLDAPALPDLTYTFDATDDSASIPWSDTDLSGADEQYRIPIGTSLLQSLWDLDDLVELTHWIELGTVASPKFELNVIEGLGEDRTGSVVGAGVCLLKEGLNITNDALVLEGAALRKASHVIVEGARGKWAIAQRPAFSAGNYTKYAKIEYTRSGSVFWLEKAGLRWLKRQDYGEKQIEIEVLPGASDASGFYFPAPDRVLWLSNLISVDTSADGMTHSPLDIQPSEDQLVTGLELELLAASDDSDATAKARSWKVLAILNRERQGTVPKQPDQASASGGGGGGGGGCPCIRLCPSTVDPVPPTDELQLAFFDANDGGTGLNWTGNLPNQSPGGAEGSNYYYFKSTSPTDQSNTNQFAASPGQVLHVTGWVKDMNGTTDDFILHFVNNVGTAVDSTMLYDSSVEGATGSTWTAFDVMTAAAPAGTTNWTLGRNGAISFDRVRVFDAGSSDPGSAGSDPLHGTDGEAAHCDHVHHVFSEDADPTIDDDEDLGYRPGTFWVNQDTGAIFILLDATDGAAVWLSVGGGDIEDHTTSETDTALTLHPDGAGGVEWGAAGAGGTWYEQPQYSLLANNLSSSSNSLVITMTAPANGDLLLLVVGSGNNRKANSGPTQTNVTWTERYNGSGNNQHVTIYTGVAAASAGTTITLGFANNSQQQGVVFKYSNHAAFTAASAVNTGTAGSGGTRSVLSDGPLTLGDWYVFAVSGPSGGGYSVMNQPFAKVFADGGQVCAVPFAANVQSFLGASLVSSAAWFATLVHLT